MSLAIPEPIRCLPDLSARPARPGRLRRLRWWLIRNTITSLLSGSRLRLSMILFCSAIFWVGPVRPVPRRVPVHRALRRPGPTRSSSISSACSSSRCWSCSSSRRGSSSTPALFHSREAAFLLTTPASTDRIFAYKFAEAIGFSSWGFFLLGSPLMVAYGLTVEGAGGLLRDVPALPALVRADPGSLGAVAAIMVANVFPEAAEGGAGGWPSSASWRWSPSLGVRLWRTPGETRSTSDWLGGMLRTGWRFARTRSGPAAGCRPGLLASAKGEWPRAGYYLMVLSAHAGLAYLAAAVVARDLYRRGYSRVQGGRSSRRRSRAVLCLDAIFHRLFFFLPRPDPAPDPQGPADLPPRPGPVVAVPDLLRPAGVLLPEHPPPELRRPELRTGGTWSAS